MSVEFSTVKVYFDDFKENIELNDSENTNENEDLSKEIIKFFVAKTVFQFTTLSTLFNNFMSDYLLSTVSKPFRSIDFPPPQLFFV